MFDWLTGTSLLGWAASPRPLVKTHRSQARRRSSSWASGRILSSIEHDNHGIAVYVLDLRGHERVVPPARVLIDWVSLRR